MEPLSPLEERKKLDIPCCLLTEPLLEELKNRSVCPLVGLGLDAAGLDAAGLDAAGLAAGFLATGLRVPDPEPTPGLLIALTCEVSALGLVVFGLLATSRSAFLRLRKALRRSLCLSISRARPILFNMLED